MNQPKDEISDLEQAAFEAKRRANEIEKEKIIRQHEREQKRSERDAKRKSELLSKLVAPAIMLITVLISLLLYFLGRG